MSRICDLCAAKQEPWRRLVALYVSDAASEPALTACIPCLLLEVNATLKQMARPYELAAGSGRAPLSSTSQTGNLASVQGCSGAAPNLTDGQMALAIDVPASVAEMPQAYTV